MVNWASIADQSDKAMAELGKGKCARCGYSYGKLMKELIESDESLMAAVWGTAKTIVTGIGEGAKKAFNTVTSFFDEL